MDKEAGKAALSVISLFIGFVMLGLGTVFGVSLIAFIGIIIISLSSKNLVAYSKNKTNNQMAPQPLDSGRKPSQDSIDVRRIFRELSRPVAERRKGEDGFDASETRFKPNSAVFNDPTAYAGSGNRPPWEIEDRRSGTAMTVVVIALGLCALILLVFGGDIATLLSAPPIKGKM